MQGTVYKSTGSRYSVKTASGMLLNAGIKGVLKLDNITSTNPVAVGDTVELLEDPEQKDAAVISNILERKIILPAYLPTIKTSTIS